MAGANCEIGMGPSGGIESQEMERHLDFVYYRTLFATLCVVAAAAAASVVLLATDPLLAVLPAAFVLGWLNLAGL